MKHTAKKIVVMGGSFNPPTIAHQRMLLGAVEAINGDLGIFVPSSHAFVSEKMKRAGAAEQVWSEQSRLELLRAMIAGEPRLRLVDLEFGTADPGVSFYSMAAIQERYPDAGLFYLVGGDKVAYIPRWHRIEEFLERYQILVVKRDEQDPERALRDDPLLRRYRDRFRVIPAPEGLDGISSSAVREKLRRGDPDAETMLHSGVWTILRGEL